MEPDRRADVRFKLSPQAPRREENNARGSSNNPKSVEAMYCFVVSISGAGISEGVSSSQLGNRSPSCFGFGNVTNVKTIYDLTRTGTTFRVSTGTARTIKVFGIYSSTLGSKCEGKSLTDLFATATRPRVYDIGRVTTDLFRDSKVTIKNDYNTATATDLAETCTSATGSGNVGDPSALPPVRGSHLIAFNQKADLTNNLLNFEVGLEGTLSLVQQLNLVLDPKGIGISVDSSQLFLLGIPGGRDRPVLGNLHKFPLDTAGSNIGRWNVSTNAVFPDEAYAQQISLPDRVDTLYYMGQDKIIGARYSPAGAPVGMSPPHYAVPFIKGMVAAHNAIIAVQGDASGTILNFNSYPIQSDGCWGLGRISVALVELT